MEAVGFVYRWTDNTNNMTYIGSHKGDINDGYIGSGVWFSRAYDLRPEAFTREILYTGENYLEVEEAYLKMLDAENNEGMYNLKNYAIGGKTPLTEKGRKVLSDNMKGDNNPSRKYGVSHLLGVPKSDSHKIKIGKANRGKKRTQKEIIKLSNYLYSYNGSAFMVSSDITKKFGISRARIHDAFRGRNKKLSKILTRKKNIKIWQVV